MLFRYRARNWPDSLSPEEREDWEAFRYDRLTSEDGPGLGLEAYNEELERRLAEPDLSDRDRNVLVALQAWGDALLT